MISQRCDPPTVLYHAGVDGGLLDVSGDASDECISVLKVGVEVWLWEDGDYIYKNDSIQAYNGRKHNILYHENVCMYPTSNHSKDI